MNKRLCFVFAAAMVVPVTLLGQEKPAQEKAGQEKSAQEKPQAQAAPPANPITASEKGFYSYVSNAAIGADLEVIERIHRLQELTVTVRAGRAKRKYRVVKSSKPDDLVFQSVRKGAPMRDNNMLSRHIKPAARAVKLDFVNWRCLRTSRATWMVEAGANPKDVQGQMRHSRISTTMDIYAQFVPESARRAMDKTREMVERRQAAMQQLATQAVQ